MTVYLIDETIIGRTVYFSVSVTHPLRTKLRRQIKGRLICAQMHADVNNQLRSEGTSG